MALDQQVVVVVVSYPHSGDQPDVEVFPDMFTAERWIVSEIKEYVSECDITTHAPEWRKSMGEWIATCEELDSETFGEDFFDLMCEFENLDTRYQDFAICARTIKDSEVKDSHDHS